MGYFAEFGGNSWILEILDLNCPHIFAWTSQSESDVLQKNPAVTGNTGNGEHGDITLKGQKEIKSDYLALPMPDCQSLENEHGTQKTLGVQEELSSKG